ncbi:MAG: serine/threonine protein kinase [Clostridium sp.]|nr:serine/threonine protein kinase [Clostridium sp.]
MAAIGAVIDGKYEILKLVGKGGMSKVYLAMDKRLNKQWAVKEIEKKARDKNNAVVIQSAIAEANMIKRLDHPTLPRIVDIIDNGNVIYIIMDYIEGESLNKVLERDGAQPQEQVIEWAKDLCEVLDYLHTREPAIIYRDMKPANVMLKPDGSLKLIDFGIAREFKEQNIEDTVSLGTKGYAAPEQFGGKGQTDARTDIYCLGVTLYHLVTGQNPCEPPYELYPIRHWDPTLSSGLEAIIQKCTQLNPADRYQSCAELMYALEHYEEADETFRLMQKGKLKKFVGVAAASVVCVLIGCICLIANSANINNQYEQKLTSASSAQSFYVDTKLADFNDEDKKGAVNLYTDAITLKPKSLEKIDIGEEKYYNPYFKIVEECKAKSDIEDSDSLDAAISIVIDNEMQYKDQQGYGELAYEIADYYLFYAPGMVQAKQLSSAEKWLNIASIEDYKYRDDDGSNNSYFESAQIMQNIMNAYKEINNLKKHSKDDDISKIVNSLQNCVSSAKGSNDSEVKLDVYSMVLIALSDSNVLAVLKDNGIPVSVIDDLIKDITEDMKSLSPEKQKKINEYCKQLKNEKDRQYGGNN